MEKRSCQDWAHAIAALSELPTLEGSRRSYPAEVYTSKVDQESEADRRDTQFAVLPIAARRRGRALVGSQR